MTASLPPVQSASAPPTPSAAPASDSSADVPFSQVLSGEMAQQRGRAADTKKAGPADKTSDAQTRDARPVDDTRAQAADTSSTVAPALLLDPAVPPALPADTAATDTATPAADALLAMAHTPDTLKPDPARTLPAESDLTGSGSATRGTGRELPGDARRARADAATLAADARAAARGPGDAGAIAARTDAVRTADPQPDFTNTLSQVQAGQAQMIQAQSTQAASLATAQLQTSDRLAPSVGTAAWNQALGDKIVWMAAGTQQSATLTLNPPDLGPLQVVLNVSNDQATAHFMAAQPEVRQALEAALPRLREMMQDAGIQLGQANVSADSPRQQDGQDRNAPRPGTPFGTSDTTGEVLGMAMPPPARAGRGLVDTFA